MALTRSRTLSEDSTNKHLSNSVFSQGDVKEGISRQNAIEKRESDINEGKCYERLVLVTSKIRQFGMLDKACKPGVLLIQLRNDATLESILQLAEERLNGQVMTSVAFIGHGQPGKMVICHDSILSVKGNQSEETEIKMFFKDLVDMLVDKNSAAAQLDLLSCPLLQNNDGMQVIQSLQDYIKIPVSATKDLLTEGTLQTENNKAQNPGESYFNAELLRGWSGSASQSISQFEKIRTVGKGAYGTAVLYRKKDDDSLVILKEINIHDLTANERQLAKNEVKVLSMLSHPNIISYYDSFEEDGTLLIEMEYADGGTLAQFLTKQEKELDEKEIIVLFQQMLSAIKYCHDHSILHRDMKTANIFLTKEGKVKLGDFGIAKIMSTRQDANTVLGTPYYISPEMCEGKPYNEKSDIWALGCMLYEMANLQKTFEGTNLPALVNKIMKGTFAPIKDIYSVEFRVLVRDMLQKEPSMRPSADEILFYRLPELLTKFDKTSDGDDLGLIGNGSRRSLLYYYDLITMKLHKVNDLPPKIHLTEVAVGLSHIAAVSLERGIFTWGDNSYGQLGHGDLKRRNSPTELVALRGKSVMRTGCGDNFTAFLSDNGLILTCGQGDLGCLGHGNWASTSKPKLIDDLLTRDVEALSCGPQHVAITTTDGMAFVWGSGEDGRLGTGNEENSCVPTEISFADRVYVRDVRCGYDCTAFILDTGTVYACGRNDYNKLGMNPRLGFLSQFKLTRSNKNPVDVQKTPSLIKDLCKYRVADVAFGLHHSAFLSETGQVFTLGNNADGQLGNGSTKQRDTFSSIRSAEDMHIMLIACGSTFSLAGTKDNRVCFWGTRPSRRSRVHSLDSVSPTQSLNSSSLLRRSRKGSTKSEESEDRLAVDDDTSGLKSDSDYRASSARRPGSITRLQRESMRSPLDRGGSAGSHQDETMETEQENIVSERKRYLQDVSTKREYADGSVGTLKMGDKEKIQAIIIPEEVLHFEAYSEPNGYEVDTEYPVLLQDIKCMRDHVVIQLETTAPPPPKKKKRLSRKESYHRHKSSQRTLDDSSSSIASHGQDDHTSSGTSEMDSFGEVPTWIRDELKSGIPLKESMDASSETNSSDEESKKQERKSRPVEQAKGVKDSPRSRSRSGSQLSRRLSNQSLMRDPNYNYVQRMSRSNQKQMGFDATKSETRIVDGVAITTTNADTTRDLSPSSGNEGNRRTSSKAMLLLDADQDVQGMSKISETGESILLSSTNDSKSSSSTGKQNTSHQGESNLSTGDSGVEFTPVEQFSTENQELLQIKGGNDQRPIQSKKSPLPARSVQMRNSKEGKSKKSQAKSVDEKMPNVRSRAVGRGRNAKSKGGFPDRNVLRDEESSKLCMELDKMRTLHQEQEQVLDDVRKNALKSEERLRKEVEKLKGERMLREEQLQKVHQEQLRQAEHRSAEQQKDAEEREFKLKDEILGLKRELNNQNDKLQDNYNILLSLQEQLLRLQQEQMKHQSMQGLPPEQLQQHLKSLHLQQSALHQNGSAEGRASPFNSSSSMEATEANERHKRVRSSVCQVM